MSRTLWNLLDDELDFQALNECGYVSYDPSMEKCTVLLCGVDMMDIAGAMGDPYDTFFVVALNDPLKELPHVPKNFDAWIDATKLGSLPTLLASYESFIERKERDHLMRASLQSFMVNSTVHKSNLEVIKGIIRSSSQEIEEIFETRVGELKGLQQLTYQLKEKITTLSDTHSMNELLSLHEEIEKQIESTMKAMRGFIIVLQCEDRISQMIDGISNIIDHDIEQLQSNGLYVPLDKEAPIKASLANFYTIQEQRDFAMGIEVAPSSCSETEEDGFILF